jgi:hypothetical protein
MRCVSVTSRRSRSSRVGPIRWPKGSRRSRRDHDFHPDRTQDRCGGGRSGRHDGLRRIGRRGPHRIAPLRSLSKPLESTAHSGWQELSFETRLPDPEQAWQVLGAPDVVGLYGPVLSERRNEIVPILRAIATRGAKLSTTPPLRTFATNSSSPWQTPSRTWTCYCCPPCQAPPASPRDRTPRGFAAARHCDPSHRPMSST